MSSPHAIFGVSSSWQCSTFSRGALLIVSGLANGTYTAALPMYIALFVVSIAIALFTKSRFASSAHGKTFLPIASLSIAMIYGIGLAFQHSAPVDTLAVTFMVLLVALPLLFVDVAWHMILFQAAWGGVFVVLSSQLNSPWAFQMNAINALTFSIVGAVLYCIISNGHVRQVVDHKRLNIMQSDVLMHLSNVIEGRDENTGKHVTRTCSFVADLLYDLREDDAWRERIPESFIDQAVLCASLHDLGKLRVPDAILNKPGRLTDEEFEVMKLHTVYGEELITRTLEGVVGPDQLAMAKNIARHHHERWDGAGYPDGLAGDAIPIEARAMALADVFDALTHERCYKEALSVEKAIQIIEEDRGTQFDPQMTDAFVARRRIEGCAINEMRLWQFEQLQPDD